MSGYENYTAEEVKDIVEENHHLSQSLTYALNEVNRLMKDIEHYEILLERYQTLRDQQDQFKEMVKEEVDYEDITVDELISGDHIKTTYGDLYISGKMPQGRSVNGNEEQYGYIVTFANSEQAFYPMGVQIRRRKN